MPFVKIEVWKGRLSSEDKEKLIQKISNLFEEFNIPVEHVNVLINESSPENWGVGGTQGSKLRK